ncbi:hypothetical protein LTR65_005817 [Meristemomyces frigidus]
MNEEVQGHRVTRDVYAAIETAASAREWWFVGWAQAVVWQVEDIEGGMRGSLEEEAVGGDAE